MQNESGDEYIRRISSFIRDNERNLAELGFAVRRPAPRRAASGSAFYNPLTWFSTEAAGPPPKSAVLTIDTHHLFYILMRLEALNLPVGTLDVRVESPSRPLSYINLFPDADKTETLSLSSFRSSFSAVSALSLGAGWWGRPEPLSVDAELKYIYSSFTILPALSVTAPSKKMIAELANEPPNENAVPMDSFKNLKSLECTNIDPRSLLGWDKLAESLISLKIKKSGLEDVSDIFVGAVLDDQARRAGSTSRQRTRRLHHRQSSFYSSQLPETVPEAADEEASSPTTPAELPSRKWAYLRHLSLSGNDLTFFPSELTPHLTSITHLDLSSNLLNSVPEGLSALYNLVSLNLADNMVESVLGIYTNLGSITFINLSRNRLESICGLERLQALERVDLRHNTIEESAEIGRLSSLPNIAEVWVEGNPFTEYEENYRVTCFDFFWKEGKTIMLDGSPPGFYEKRNLTFPPAEVMASSRPVSAAYSPPTIAIGHSHSHSHPSSPPLEASSSSTSLPTASSSTSPHIGPIGAIGVSGRSRKKKAKRIVDLDGGNGSEDGVSLKSSSHKRTTSNDSGRSKHGRSTKNKPSSQPLDHQSFGQFVSLLAIPQNLPPTVAEEQAARAGPSSKSALIPEDSSSSKPPPPPFPPIRPEFRSNISSRPNNRKSRHTRYKTDIAALADSDEDSPLPTQTVTTSSDGSPPPSAATPTFRRSRDSQTFSSAKASARRARVTASVYESPSLGIENRSSSSSDGLEGESEADAFRRRIEALKNDMGDGWLKIFSQTQMKTPSPS